MKSFYSIKVLFSLVLLTAIGLLPVVAFCSATISICSFNIQFLGNSSARHNSALSEVINNYDIVVVQELVAPPFTGSYPNGDSYKADSEAAVFFEEMTSRGFSYVLSEEDTGTGSKIHLISTDLPPSATSALDDCQYLPQQKSGGVIYSIDQIAD